MQATCLSDLTESIRGKNVLTVDKFVNKSFIIHGVLNPRNNVYAILSTKQRMKAGNTNDEKKELDAGIHFLAKGEIVLLHPEYVTNNNIMFRFCNVLHQG